jgi:flagellar biosynthesis/type III secretory pathway protein FliH
MPSLAQRWLEEGIQQGMQQGIQIGVQKGREEGRTEGIVEGVFETAIKMIERFNLSVDDVIKELNLKKDEPLEYMKNRDK